MLKFLKLFLFFLQRLFNLMEHFLDIFLLLINFFFQVLFHMLLNGACWFGLIGFFIFKQWNLKNLLLRSYLNSPFWLFDFLIIFGLSNCFHVRSLIFRTVTILIMLNPILFFFWHQISPQGLCLIFWRIGALHIQRLILSLRNFFKLKLFMTKNALHSLQMLKVCFYFLLQWHYFNGFHFYLFFKFFNLFTQAIF